MVRSQSVQKFKKTVFVGLSGGVDSSVAALRLLREGYDVVGVFIKVWQPDFLVCNWEQERLDAMRVAAHLEIPFITFDAAEAYKRDVGEYFINEYKLGRTPNPDVMCNKSVKFGAFLAFARANGADYAATGHYAQVVESGDIHSLLRGIDRDKDQSYFLWTLTQDQLKHVLLPVGNSTKVEIRSEAARVRIPTAKKKDSQGICFLGHVDIAEFIGHFVDLAPGDVIDESGKVIGMHKGALVYTLGQRHGFTITHDAKGSRTHFVTAKNIEKNTITVAPKPLTSTQGEKINLTGTNWIDEQPKADTMCATQFRYRQKPLPTIIERVDHDSCTLTLDTTVETPAAGQSCVLYDGQRCLGGGIIM